MPNLVGVPVSVPSGCTWSPGGSTPRTNDTVGAGNPVTVNWYEYGAWRSATSGDPVIFGGEGGGGETTMVTVLRRGTEAVAGGRGNELGAHAARGGVPVSVPSGSRLSHPGTPENVTVGVGDPVTVNW